MTITHIFFDLHGTLIDSARLQPAYTTHLARVMSQRYGSTPSRWIKADQAILADWDSYYADLGLDGEHGLDDLWEGLFRTTRALFRLVNVPEPDKETLTRLARTLPGEITRFCNAVYPDAHPVIRQLDKEGYVLGVTTHSIHVYAEGVLDGSNVRRHFRGPIVAVDDVGHFEKDESFFQIAMGRANVKPEQCLVVDDAAHVLAEAKKAGLHTVHLMRRGESTDSPADYQLQGDLTGLCSLVASIQKT